MWIDPANPLRIYLGNDGGFYSHHERRRGVDASRRTCPSPSSTRARSIPRIPRGCSAGRRTTTRCITIGIADATGPGSSAATASTAWSIRPIPTSSSPSTRTARAARARCAPPTAAAPGRTPTGFDPERPLQLVHAVRHGPHQSQRAAGREPPRLPEHEQRGRATSPISDDLTTNPRRAAHVRHHHDARHLAAEPGHLLRRAPTTARCGARSTRARAGPRSRPGCRCAGSRASLADPVDAQTVYVTLSGFGNDEHLAHVYRSTNRGRHLDLDLEQPAGRAGQRHPASTRPTHGRCSSRPTSGCSTPVTAERAGSRSARGCRSRRFSISPCTRPPAPWSPPRMDARSGGSTSNDLPLAVGDRARDARPRARGSDPESERRHHASRTRTLERKRGRCRRLRRGRASRAGPAPALVARRAASARLGWRGRSGPARLGRRLLRSLGGRQRRRHSTRDSSPLIRGVPRADPRLTRI